MVDEMCISKVPLLSLFPMYRIHIRKRRMHRKKARGGEEAKKAPASFFFPIPACRQGCIFPIFKYKGDKKLEQPISTLFENYSKCRI